MIRLLGNRLIIPKGDSGEFTFPTLYSSSETDLAVFSIFDPLYKKSVLLKKIPVSYPQLTFSFSSADTEKLTSKKYYWDISIYINPVYDEDENLIGADEVHSYFSAYKLPICRISESAYTPQEEDKVCCKCVS